MPAKTQMSIGPLDIMSQDKFRSYLVITFVNRTRQLQYVLYGSATALFYALGIAHTRGILHSTVYISS